MSCSPASLPVAYIFSLPILLSSRFPQTAMERHSYHIRIAAGEDVPFLVGLCAI
jgi:hypothetical protein